MIVLVCDDNSSASINGNSCWPVELPRARPVCSESPDKAAILSVNLNAVVGPVRNNEVTLFVASHAPGSAQVFRGVPVGADYLDLLGQSVLLSRTASAHRHREV